jgi:hypothetical protein
MGMNEATVKTIGILSLTSLKSQKSKPPPRVHLSQYHMMKNQFSVKLKPKNRIRKIPEI